MIEKFPYNEIISILDVNLDHNLAESTSEDLILGNILDESLLESLSKVRLGYGTSQGNADLRQMIAKKVNVTPDKVLVTNGSSVGLFLISFCLADKDDEVVVVEPNFPPTLDVVTAIGAVKKPLQATFDEGYKLNIERLSELLSNHTKLVILVSPQNPSGVAISPTNIESALALIEEKAPQAYLLVDETYREAVYGSSTPQPSVADLSPRVLTTASLSKCHGAPGLRIGWLTCHDTRLMQQLASAKLNTVISCSVVDEVIGLHVLTQGNKLLAERGRMLGKALLKVEAWVAQNSELVEWVKPDAGALCCIRLRKDKFTDKDIEEFYKLAISNQVQLGKGPWFAEENRVFRLGFGFLPLDKLQPALDAISATLKQSIS